MSVNMNLTEIAKSNYGNKKQVPFEDQAQVYANIGYYDEGNLDDAGNPRFVSIFGTGVDTLERDDRFSKTSPGFNNLIAAINSGREGIAQACASLTAGATMDLTRDLVVQLRRREDPRKAQAAAAIGAQPKAFSVFAKPVAPVAAVVESDEVIDDGGDVPF